MYTVEQFKKIAALLQRTSSHCGFYQPLGQWQQNLAKALGCSSWQHYLAINTNIAECNIESTICICIKEGAIDSFLISNQIANHVGYVDINFHKEKILQQYNKKKQILHIECNFSRPLTRKFNLDFYTTPPLTVKNDDFEFPVFISKSIQNLQPDSGMIPYVIKPKKNTLSSPIFFVWFLTMKKHTPVFIERNTASSNQNLFIYDLLHSLTGIKTEPRRCLMVDPFTGQPSWVVEGSIDLINISDASLSSNLSWFDLENRLDELNYAQGLSYLDIQSIQDAFMTMLDEAPVDFT
jgi:hypothetical protein